MANKNNKNLSSINVGVVGHIDHGKTTLLSKLTGKIADTHSEELKRGITIKLGYADITIYKDKDNYNINSKGTPQRHVSFIDAPGHEMLMATMLSGAAIMDAAILVIAANEGIKPQTREHFMALQSKGIKNLIIVQNKIDIVSKEKALENYNEIKQFLKGTSAENSPIIPVSSQQEINIDKILNELVNIPVPKRDTESEPIFLIARSFDINRPGKSVEELKGGVLGGILKKGTLKKGDKIEIKPGVMSKKANQTFYQPLESEIISLQKGDELVEKVTPGASISIETSLDPSLTKTDSLIGCIASTKGSLPPITYKLKMSFKLFNEVLGAGKEKTVEKIKTKEMLMLNVNTTITVGIVEKISPDKNEIELSLNIPVVALKGNNIGIARNFNGHWRLIGYGSVL
ncbi:MAG: translation initiation factor IF-2 subunit gamma [Nanoarchaeota archaeon]